MQAETTKSKWWLAAILAPLLSVGFGVLFASSASPSENDWLGLSAIAPLFWGLIGGCAVSCVAAVVSVVKREKLWPAALIAAIPSLLFFIHLFSLEQQAKQTEKRNREYRVIADKQEKERRAKIDKLYSELRRNPQLIMSDEFWRNCDASNDLKRIIVSGTLQDRSFKVTPEIKDHVRTNYPQFSHYLIMYGRSSHEELESIARDEKLPSGYRNTAVECLLRDESFRVAPEFKRLVIDHFSYHFFRLHFTKRELEDLAADPTVSERVRKWAVAWLKEKRYVDDARSVN
jgi:hypothetical protein